MSKFIHSDLGERAQGEVVEVTLTARANVLLLDDQNFRQYSAGQGHRYFGGMASRSPVRLAIPSPGHWHVAVDLQGLQGSVRASFRMIDVEAPQASTRLDTEV